MAEPNEDLIIEPDAPEPDPVVVEKTEPAVVDPEEGVEALKQKLAQSEAAKTAAQKEARRHAEAATAARTEKQDGDVQLVTSAITTLKETNDRLEEKNAELLAAGEFSEASKVQREMLRNEARLNTLESGLEQLKAQPKPKSPEIADDPVEKLASQLSPRSAQWVRAHPECATDPRMERRMLAAHNLAITDGLKPDTDEYFAAVERTIGFSKTDDAVSAAAEPTQRRQSPVAAPVGRGAAPNGNAQTVRLTAEEREIAQMNGMTDVEYARNKLALVKEGRLQ